MLRWQDSVTELRQKWTEVLRLVGSWLDSVAQAVLGKPFEVSGNFV